MEAELIVVTRYRPRALPTPDAADITGAAPQ
jgi:hypothetical protein